MPMIYLVRHGQTDWNAQLRLQGQGDTPLNGTGRGQAVRNGAVLAELISDPATFDFVASPLGRTRETMEIIREAMGLRRDDYKTDDRLMEINFGEWQGSTWEELRTKYLEKIAARFDDPWNTVAPGPRGESFAMLSARALAWMGTLERDTVAITHGGVIRCIMGNVEKMPRHEIPLIEIRQDCLFALQNGQIRQI